MEGMLNKYEKFHNRNRFVKVNPILQNFFYYNTAMLKKLTLTLPLLNASDGGKIYKPFVLKIY